MKDDILPKTATMHSWNKHFLQIIWWRIFGHNFSSRPAKLYSKTYFNRPLSKLASKEIPGK